MKHIVQQLLLAATAATILSGCFAPAYSVNMHKNDGRYHFNTNGKTKKIGHSVVHISGRIVNVVAVGKDTPENRKKAKAALDEAYDGLAKSKYRDVLSTERGVWDLVTTENYCRHQSVTAISYRSCYNFHAGKPRTVYRGRRVTFEKESGKCDFLLDGYKFKIEQSDDFDMLKRYYGGFFLASDGENLIIYINGRRTSSTQTAAPYVTNYLLAIQRLLVDRLKKNGFSFEDVNEIETSLDLYASC